MTNARIITARNLVLMFLELRRLSPNYDEWTEEHQNLNPPRLFRLRQLAALFRAFGIPWHPASFIEGRFIQPEDPRHDTLLAKFATDIAEEPRGRIACGLHPNDSRRFASSLPSKRNQLPEFFAILFSYRERIDQVLSFSSGVIEASGLYLQAHLVAAKLNRRIEDNISIVEDMLVSLISPEAAEFSVEQLARDHGYPDVNLDDIDEEWF